MSDTLSVGGYGFQPVGTTRPTSDRPHDDKNRDPPSDSFTERRETTDKEQDVKPPIKTGVGDNIDLEA